MGETTGVATRPRSTRRFWAVLGLILVAALGVRILYVDAVARHDDKFYDAAYYQLQADANSDGDWFLDGTPGVVDRGPAADHPPLTALVLTPVAMVWRIDNLMKMRFVMAILGVGVVGVIGLLGRAVGGDRVGWLAAGLAAVYPYLWVNDGLVMSETLAAGLTAAAVLLAYRFCRAPGVAVAIGLGLICGLATLTRAELALLAPLLAIPAAWRLRDRTPGRRVALAAIALIATGIVVSPWIGFNATRFHEPVLISTNEGTALLGSSCANVFHGPGIGTTDLRCLPAHVPPGDETEQSAAYREQAIDYLRDHLDRYPIVLLARIGRNWEPVRPLDMLSLNEGEGRPRWITGAGLAFYYPLLLLAIVGAVVTVRRRRWVWPLLVPAIIVTIGAIPAYGQTRFRVPAEPSIVVLAAVALVAGAERASRRPALAEAPT